MPIAKTPEAELERREKISKALKGVPKDHVQSWSDSAREKQSALMRARWASLPTEQRVAIGCKIAKALTKSPPLQDPDIKGCSVCGRVLPSTTFYEDRRSKSGLQSACKDCFGHRVKTFYLQYPEKRVSQRRARYNINFNALWDKQGGNCALCGEPMEIGGQRSLSAVIDHDHSCCSGSVGKSCGKCVRGLLHNHCNKFLGHIENRHLMVEQAIVYLTRWRETQK